MVLPFVLVGAAVAAKFVHSAINKPNKEPVARTPAEKAARRPRTPRGAGRKHRQTSSSAADSGGASRTSTISGPENGATDEQRENTASSSGSDAGSSQESTPRGSQDGSAAGAGPSSSSSAQGPKGTSSAPTSDSGSKGNMVPSDPLAIAANGAVGAGTAAAAAPAAASEAPPAAVDRPPPAPAATVAANEDGSAPSAPRVVFSENGASESGAPQGPVTPRPPKHPQQPFALQWKRIIWDESLWDDYDGEDFEEIQESLLKALPPPLSPGHVSAAQYLTVDTPRPPPDPESDRPAGPLPDPPAASASAPASASSTPSPSLAPADPPGPSHADPAHAGPKGHEHHLVSHDSLNLDDLLSDSVSGSLFTELTAKHHIQDLIDFLTIRSGDAHLRKSRSALHIPLGKRLNFQGVAGASPTDAFSMGEPGAGGAGIGADADADPHPHPQSARVESEQDAHDRRSFRPSFFVASSPPSASSGIETFGVGREAVLPPSSARSEGTAPPAAPLQDSSRWSFEAAGTAPHGQPGASPASLASASLVLGPMDDPEPSLALDPGAASLSLLMDPEDEEERDMHQGRRSPAASMIDGHALEEAAAGARVTVAAADKPGYDEDEAKARSDAEAEASASAAQEDLAHTARESADGSLRLVPLLPLASAVAAAAGGAPSEAFPSSRSSESTAASDPRQVTGKGLRPSLDQTQAEATHTPTPATPPPLVVPSIDLSRRSRPSPSIDMARVKGLVQRVVGRKVARGETAVVDVGRPARSFKEESSQTHAVATSSFGRLLLLRPGALPRYTPKDLAELGLKATDAFFGGSSKPNPGPAAAPEAQISHFIPTYPSPGGGLVASATPSPNVSPVQPPSTLPPPAPLSSGSGSTPKGAAVRPSWGRAGSGKSSSTTPPQQMNLSLGLTAATAGALPSPHSGPRAVNGSAPLSARGKGVPSPRGR